MYKYVSFMNIYHLKYFIDAARLGSISRSAETNHIGHSAVSQAIRALESQLNVQLMYHSKRKFQLTPEGESCLAEGQKILLQMAALKESLQAQASEPQGELSVQAPQTIVVDLLLDVFEAYKKAYPKVKVRFHPGAAAQVRSAVRREDCQIGFLLDDSYLEKFESLLIKKGDFVLVSRKPDVNIEKTNVMVTSREKVEVQHLNKNFRRAFAHDLKIESEVMSWTIIKKFALRGFAVGYVPDYCVQQELKRSKLHILQSPGTPFRYEMRAIWPKNKRLHRNAQLFIDLMKKMQ